MVEHGVVKNRMKDSIWYEEIKSNTETGFTSLQTLQIST